MIKKSILIIFSVVILIGVTGAFVYNHYDGSLSSGTFNETLYNATGEYVHLNWSDATNTSYVESGNYTSPVIDLGVSTGFVEIKWEGKGSCPENMSYIDKLGGYCIDQYEASKPDATLSSAGSDTSMATSKPNVLPWVSVTLTAARTACVNAGKHLCSSEEWLGAGNIQGQVYNLPADLSSVGSNYNCNTNSICGGVACPTSLNTSLCVSAEGVYDMVGNVREWCNEVVNTIKPCNVGSNGYCYANSTGGWQTSTSSATTLYGNDGVYFLANSQSNRAVNRGGRWNSGALAGLFYASLYYEPSYPDSNIGFRCCSSPT